MVVAPALVLTWSMWCQQFWLSPGVSGNRGSSSSSDLEHRAGEVGPGQGDRQSVGGQPGLY